MSNEMSKSWIIDPGWRRDEGTRAVEKTPYEKGFISDIPLPLIKTRQAAGELPSSDDGYSSLCFDVSDYSLVIQAVL